MEYNEQDTDVIRLFTQLKEAEGSYPVEMMTSRRQGYLKQIAALGIGVGAGIALKASAKGAGGSSIPPIAGTILETALIIAIVAEAGFVAIVNRQKVLDLFRTISGPSEVQQASTSTPPDSAVPLPVGPTLVDTLEPTLVETLEPTETITETSTAAPTPLPDLLLLTDANLNDAGSEVVPPPADSTPAPNDDNGNHYGQTPKPERTRESENDRNSGGNSSNSRRNK